MSSPSTHATLLTFLLLVCLSTAQNSDAYPSVAKRGGARAFHGFYSMPSSKRLSGYSPYYFYEKRGGGRAFVGGGWQPFESLSNRMERRGGGRAFSGWWGPSDYFSRFYENPYYKRSSNLWEFLEDRNAV